MSEELKQLAEVAKKNSESIATLSKGFTDVMDKLSKIPAYPPGANPWQVFGPPNIRHGENSQTSRGFSFLKMLGVLTGACTREEAKVEVDVHDKLNKVFCKDMGTAGYAYGGQGHTGLTRFLAPLSTSFFPEGTVEQAFRDEMKSLVMAGTASADPDEMNWIRRKMHAGKALSWLQENLGGALVAPPEQGELIELLRNKEALVNAGARTVPLPPQGRVRYPRQTTASTTYWVGENKTVTDSDIGTGDVSLQAKKLAVLIKAPNELIRFASPAAEAVMRDDMTKSLALGLDLAGLEGAGGDTRPRGLILMPNINTVVSGKTGADGDTIIGPDLYRMLAVVEESNAEFEAWIMRPKTLYKYYQLRSDAVGQGDSAGPFLFNLIREAGDGTKPTLAGYPVVKSTQISQVRSKGSSSSLTYLIGGAWSELLIGMFGAIEFAQTSMGDTAFERDQTWVRGILSADIAARHEAAFCFMDTLSTTL